MIALMAVNQSLYDTSPDHSYSCKALLKTSLSTVMVDNELMEGDKMTPFKSGTFETSDLAVQAFLPSDKKTTTFLPSR